MATMTALTSILEKIEELDFKFSQQNELLALVAKQQAHINKNTPNLKKLKKEKLAGEPKKNISAFFHFCKESRPNITKANPDASTPEITKLMSLDWHTLKDTKKTKKFDDIAVSDKARYIKEKADFDAMQAQKKVS